MIPSVEDGGGLTCLLWYGYITIYKDGGGNISVHISCIICMKEDNIILHWDSLYH